MPRSSIASALFVAVSIHAAGVAAQPSPEPPADFAGRWRVVSVEPAPWRNVRGGRLDYRGFGMVVGAGGISGPGGLSCGRARYETLSVPARGLFEGGLPAARARALAERLGLDPEAAPTFRVACENGSFDYHRTRDGTLKIVIDEMVHTLARPPQYEIDDHDFVSQPKASFQCARARTTPQRVICSNEATMHADWRLGEEYARLIGELSRAGRESLTAVQRTYLRQLHEVCEVAGEMPRGEALQDAAQCLADSLLGRARFFTDVGAVGTYNRLSTEPRFTTRVRAVPGADGEQHFEDDATPFAVEGPAPAREAFNAHVRSVLRPGQPLHATPATPGTVERKYTPSLNSNGLVSFTVTQTFTGGTAVDPRIRSINWNDAASRPLHLDDLFVAGSDWRAAFRAAAERLWSDPAARAAFLAELDDPTRWSFERERVRIWSAHDRPGEINTDCAFCGVEIPAAALRPFLRPDSPWRPE